MFTFGELKDKEAAQCPMAKGSVCAYGGGGRSSGRRGRGRVMVLCRFFFSFSFSFDIMKGGTTGTEERLRKQTGERGEVELQMWRR